MLRKSLKYPPFCDIIMLLITGENEKEVIRNIKKITRIYKTQIKNRKFENFTL